MNATPADEEGVARLVRDCYDQIAVAYMVQAMGPGPGPRQAWVARLCERLVPGSAVLDLGCGSGVPAAAALVAAGHGVTGVDLSPCQVALASRNVPGGEFAVGDAVSVEFDDTSFDGVAMLYAITHVPRHLHARVIARIHRWLRPGGWLLINFGTSDSSGWLEENFLGHGVQSWTNSWDPDTSVSLVEAAGFTVEHADRVGTDGPTGREEWLWVLARRDRPPAQPACRLA